MLLVQLPVHHVDVYILQHVVYMWSTIHRAYFGATPTIVSLDMVRWIRYVQIVQHRDQLTKQTVEKGNKTNMKMRSSMVHDQFTQ